VDNAGATCSGAHSGTKADPYCQIQSAVDAASPKATIRVLGSSAVYDKVNVSSGNFTIIGPGQKGTTPAAIVSYTTGSAFNVSGMSTVVTFDGFEVTGGTANQDAIACSNNPLGPTLTVRRSYIHDVGGAGINVSKCKVTLDRNQIGPGCAGGGVVLRGAQYSITNNFVVANASVTHPGITLDGSPLGAGNGFKFNTVAGNGGVGTAGGLQCSGGTQNVDDSIIFNNSKTGAATAATQFTGTCSFTYLTTDDGTTPTGAGNNATAPDFVSTTPTSPDYHLMGRTGNNSTCCVDRIPTSAVLFDYDGRPRPQPVAGMFDVGAHEVP